jgi:polysaccharide biosynthesis PFTS motif protein
MIWYSTNSDLIYKNGVKPFKIQNNYLSLDRIDQHLVWDIYAKKTLAKMTNKQIFASGSLLFYPKKMQKKRVGENSYKVLVFDVTPAEGTTGEDFLNSSQAIETIREIVNAAHKFNSNSNKELNLFLKPKRRYSKSHSGEYIRYIAKLQRQKKIRLINYSSNLYEIINDADLVIGFPWTSPAAVANEIKVKSLYYISDREYNWNLMKRKNTVLLRKENDLYNFIKKNLVR